MIVDDDIPDEILSQYNLTYDEFLFLLLQIRCQDFHSLTARLIAKNIGKPCRKDDEILVTSQKEHRLVDSILTNYKRHTKMARQKVPINPDYITLAGKMQELFPKGIRPGCSTTWRGNKLILARRLTNLATDYQVEFTEEQALDATRRYVEHFEGDYTYMECLEHFILRVRPDFKSNFLSYLENTDTESKTNDFVKMR